MHKSRRSCSRQLGSKPLRTLKRTLLLCVALRMADLFSCPGCQQCMLDLSLEEHCPRCLYELPSYKEVSDKLRAANEETERYRNLWKEARASLRRTRSVIEASEEDMRSFISLRSALRRRRERGRSPSSGVDNTQPKERQERSRSPSVVMVKTTLQAKRT